MMNVTLFSLLFHAFSLYFLLSVMSLSFSDTFQISFNLAPTVLCPFSTTSLFVSIYIYASISPLGPSLSIYLSISIYLSHTICFSPSFSLSLSLSFSISLPYSLSLYLSLPHSPSTSPFLPPPLCPSLFRSLSFTF